MILNYNHPRIVAIRSQISFRDPQNLFTKPEPLCSINEYDWLTKGEQFNFRCCMCYEAVVDPRMCKKCKIIFCA